MKQFTVTEEEYNLLKRYIPYVITNKNIRPELKLVLLVMGYIHFELGYDPNVGMIHKFTNITIDEASKLFAEAETEVCKMSYDVLREL